MVASSITPVVLNRAFKLESTFTNDMFFIFSLPLERQESRVLSGRCDKRSKKLKRHKRNHKPRNASDLWNLEKAKTQDFSWSQQKEYSLANILILAQ